jgi:threonine dehydrogenase-like Zn-dependent dehydrogenase
MKAAFFQSPGRIELREVETPEPRGNEVLVRVASCGICGSDVAAFRSGESPWHRRGHEFSGFVEKTGRDAALEPGALVSGIGSLPCGKCSYCSAGRPRHCEQPVSGGHDAFAEYVCKDERFLYPCAGLTLHEAALFEPLTVAIDLVADAAVASGSSVLVMGAGPIGLMALTIARIAGASRAYVYHPSAGKARREAALKLGADHLFAPDAEDLPKALLNIEPRGVDAVLITAPPSAVMSQAAKVTAIGGTIAFVGMEWKSVSSLEFDVDGFHFRKLRLVGSNHNPCGPLYPTAAELLRSKRIDAGVLISHSFPLSQILAAFEKAEDRANVVKIIVDCSEGVTE